MFVMVVLLPLSSQINNNWIHDPLLDLLRLDGELDGDEFADDLDDEAINQISIITWHSFLINYKIYLWIIIHFNQKHQVYT